MITENQKINSEEILCINAIETRDRSDLILSNLDDNVDIKTKERLLNIFAEVDDMSLKPVKDNYHVQVNIKDDSIYAYAPRRMSYNEKLKLREITDDLLKRGIIVPSSSPYCARVVPVTKKKEICECV